MAIGLFHTRLNVGNGLPGAPFLTLDLLVNVVSKKVTGKARLYQATHPVQVFHADVWGSYSELPFVPAASPSVILHLDGSPSGPFSQIAQTFHLQGLLDKAWSHGTASYRYFANGHWIDQHGRVRKVPEITHQDHARPAERLKAAIKHLEHA
ncbi:DUF1842 domain-containing protein [Pantoea sp. Cy-639]|jgi:hypothetical protein|uniref:DUF1842 domain-containing protein n=1 Tax=Pantoea sp. Cy-639 TaxID=2608360 RepID=UPI0014231382|nr:DUF1842 domain-containing protein [Pantoea sp. Cy-639]NIF17810.1 DUF1842 domain-containing protein [Pantoea sp. Cy-639]